MKLKRLSGNKLEKHLDQLNKLGFVDVTKLLCAKLLEEKNNPNITYHEVRYVIDRLK